MSSEQLRAQITQIDQEIAKIESILGSERVAPSAEDLQIQRYEAAAKASAGFDPQQAQSWMQKADRIREQRESMDLKREAFDYKRAQDLLRVEQPTKKETRELEQLWKDAERSLRHARQTRDPESVKYYEDFQSKLVNRLKVLRPIIWDDKTGGQVEEKKEAIESSVDFSDINSKVKGMAIDADRDGNVDNMADIKASIRSWAVDNGIPTNNPSYNDMFSYLDDKQAQFEKERGSRIKTHEISMKQVGEDMKYDEKFKWLYNPYQSLKNNPNDIAAKNDALMSALRKESGAAIGADEFINFMGLALTGEDLKQFKDDTTGLGQLMLGMASDNARDSYIKRLGMDYMDRTNTDKIIDKITSKIPDKYLEKKAGSKKKATSKPSAPSGESKLDRLRRLRAARKGG